MNTIELESIIRTHWPIGSKLLFNGVFARDEIQFKKNGIYVINTGDKLTSGEHWFCCLKKPNISEIFDSYGGWVVKNVNLDGIIHPKKTFIYNTERIQSDNYASCGIYSLFYCLERAKNRSLREIVQDFSINNQISCNLHRRRGGGHPIGL